MNKPVRCSLCDDSCCVCEDGGKWAAHCMLCDNAIGKPGFYSPCADSEQEAVQLWNQLNSNLPKFEGCLWDNISAHDKNKPMMLSCPCPRCSPSC